MIRSGDGRTNKNDVEAGNTYDNAVIENTKIFENNKIQNNKIQNNQSMLDDIMNSTQYPKQLQELALKNEEALEFVYDYPTEHVKEHTIDLTEEASMDSVPLFVQWDKRWGYEKYSGNFFAASGCGPTTLSMVVVYLTHNRDASPLAVAKYSKKAGYSVDGSGSSWTLISEGCRHYGVKAKTVALDESRMKAELDAGHLIVVNVGLGDFTDTGHFMVITGYDDEGFSINDPNSIEKSGKRWLFKNISSQIRAVWSMYV
ncbi:MAG: C39 family peptidase [Agathobacter rectalis]